jgi:hypothetical protein
LFVGGMATESGVSQTEDFKTAYCKRSKCPGEAFEKRLLRECLAPHVRPLAFVIRLFRRDFFRWDVEFLRRVGQARAVDAIALDVEVLRQDSRLRRGFLRGILRVRISSRRLTRLAQEVFG